MDLWVVAAAAGAGYLAKYWKNIGRDRDGSSELYHDNVEWSSLIHRIHGKYSNHELPHCESGYRNQLEGMSGEISSKDDRNLPPSSGFPQEYRKYENIENESGNVFDNDIGYISERKDSQMGAPSGARRSKNTLRSKHLHLQYVNPRGSLDSCLTAHMHGENAELEEYLRSPLFSPCTMTLRPFLVTDGRRVISRVSGNFSDEVLRNIHQKTIDGVNGIPTSPLIGEANLDKSGMQKWSSRRTSIQSDSQDGSSSGRVLFCLGISIGIMCSIISNNRDIEKLKESLTQTGNLVQDLQEELEMKDSLTVKELVYDDESQDTRENLCCDKRMNMFPNQMNANVAVNCADRSKIEAELEAELERLELSMVGSTLRGRLCDNIEFDQEVNDDTTPELVRGELNANVIQQRSSSEPSHDHQTSGTSTPCSAKHGVSPRELSLRLHELVQSRLQDRIIELEKDLTKTQKRVRDLESEKVVSWREVSYSESSSTLGSPVVMTLSDDALDAYNDAYYELSKLKGSHNEARGNVLSTTNKGLFDGRNGAKKITSEGAPSDDEYDIGDDLLLIQQIVEKARQGSPAVLRAQRAMVYLDD